MPSMPVVVVAVLIAFISVVAVLFAVSRRQYDPNRARARPGSEETSSDLPGGLAPLVASTISEASNLRPRNSSEAAAIASLRTALDLAVDGDFEAEVRSALDAIEGIESLHDVRRGVVGGASIDHLVVAPIGVAASGGLLVHQLVTASVGDLIRLAALLGTVAALWLVNAIAARR